MKKKLRTVSELSRLLNLLFIIPAFENRQSEGTDVVGRRFEDVVEKICDAILANNGKRLFIRQNSSRSIDLRSFC